MKQIQSDLLYYGVSRCEKKIFYKDQLAYFKTGKYFDCFRPTLNNIKVYDCFGNRIKAPTVFSLRAADRYPELFYSIYNFFNGDYFNELYNLSINHFPNIEIDIIELRELYLSLNFDDYSLYLRSEPSESGNFFRESTLVFDKVYNKILEILAKMKRLDTKNKYKVMLTFPSNILKPWILEPNMIYYKSFIGIYQSNFVNPKYKQIVFDLFPKEIIELTLKSIMFNCEGVKYYIPQHDKIVKNVKRRLPLQIVLADQYDQHWYNFPGIIAFLSKIQDPFFQTFKDEITKSMKEMFSYPLKNDYISLKAGNSYRKVGSFDFSQQLTVLKLWTDYWETNYKVPYNPDIFVYYLSNYIDSPTGLFEIASPPDSKTINMFWY